MAPGLDGAEYVKRAKLVIDDIVLRDLVLHEKYGVAVNEKGDVMQWGIGFTDIEAAILHGADTTAPHPTLIGKDIMKVTATENKVFALSRKVSLFVLELLGNADGVNAGRDLYFPSHDWKAESWRKRSKRFECLV